jgi:hypothetical protein
MATIMNMSGYEVEHEEMSIEEYGDEVMCAGWNPQLAMLRNRPAVTADKHKAYMPEMADVDIDAFLQLMYKYQH